MKETILIIVNTALINNLVLVKFLGLCPLLGTSRNMDSALGMSFATLLVLTVSSGVSYLLNQYVLVPNDLEFLRILAFIIVIALVVQMIKVLIQRHNPLLHNRLGIYLPLITTNCAILGVALLNIRNAESFVHSLGAGFGTGIGFGLVLLIFASLREKLDVSSVPSLIRGTPIALITAGIMSLAFTGFSGLAR